MPVHPECEALDHGLFNIKCICTDAFLEELFEENTTDSLKELDELSDDAYAESLWELT